MKDYVRLVSGWQWHCNWASAPLPALPSNLPTYYYSSAAAALDP